MRLIGALALGVLAVGLAGAGHAPEPPPFAVSLPPGFTTRVSEGPDFTVWYFEKGGKAFAGAYAGNFPQFPVKTGADREPVGPYQQTVVCAGSEVKRRDILLVLKQDFPRLIHAWTVDLPAADRASAEAILTSIHTAGNPGVPASALQRCG